MRNTIESVDWIQLQKNHDSGVSWYKLGVSTTLLKKAENLGMIINRKIRQKLSDSTKRKMSISKKEFYKNNKHKHNWKTKKSIPCEKFKEMLIKHNISFIEEYTPLDDRFYAIDVAFPDKKIGIEINGNQHYNPDGTLKDYYKDRHDTIEKNGWKLLEYHFSVCYNKEMCESIIKEIQTEFNLTQVDYTPYIKKQNCCVDCGVEIKSKSKRCLKCSGLLKRKCERPSVETLLKELENNTMESIAKKYNVSSTAIRKWLRNASVSALFPKQSTVGG